MTDRANCAASRLSMMRWSKAEERFVIFRGTAAPSSRAGRATTRLAATIATSGRLMIGAAASPPPFPRLETVTVDPAGSWRVIGPSRAAAASRPTSAASSRIPMSLASRTTGATRPFSVWVAIPACTRPNCGATPRASPWRLLAPGRSRTAGAVSPDDERRRRQPGVAGGAVEGCPLAQLPRPGHVDRLHVGEMRGVTRGVEHAPGDFAP